MTQQQFKGARVERHGCAERHGVLALSLPLPQSMLIPVKAAAAAAAAAAVAAAAAAAAAAALGACKRGYGMASQCCSPF